VKKRDLKDVSTIKHDFSVLADVKAPEPSDENLIIFRAGSTGGIVFHISRKI
jgi:hypothetical protein